MMPGDSDLEIPVVYLRWKVNTWSRVQYQSFSNPWIFSPKFRFQGRQWKLCYHYDKKHVLGLNKMSDGYYAPFAVSAHVESSGTGRIVTELSWKKRVEGFCNVAFWSKPDAEVMRADPEFRRNNYDLRFLVVLKKDDVLTDTDTKFTQTECYSHEVVEQACIATQTSFRADSYLPEAGAKPSKLTSTSVQTSLLQNVSPCLEYLSEDLDQMMVNGTDYDMEFHCGGQSIRAHKLIICSRSPVIASMLENRMVEERANEVILPDMDPEVFKKLLRYLYTGKLDELTFDAALILCEVGSQYAVRGLDRICSEFLVEHLTVENACDALAVIDRHGNSKNVIKAIEYILENKIPAVNDRWSGFCSDHPKLAIRVLGHSYESSLN